MADDEEKPTVVVGDIDDLVARSSLGTPGAVAVRRRAYPKTVEEIVARSMEPREPSDGDEEEMDASWLADLEHRLNGVESKIMSEDQAREWWRRARYAWGQLQQVRKGTRVHCIYGCRSGCPMCEYGFMDRNEALRYLETDMEFARK